MEPAEADDLAGTFGQVLRQLRLRAGLSLRELGQRALYDYTRLSRAERDEITIPLDQVQALDALLGAGGKLTELRKDMDAGERVTPYADRGHITRRQWNDIIAGTTTEVWLYGMAEYGYATDDDVPAILAASAARGCRIRILLLHPASKAAAGIDHDEGHPPGTLAARIRAALAHFGSMRRECGDLMDIRVYDGHPTVSVVRGDNRLLVTPYLRYFVGSNSPTFELRADRAPKMFARYARQFENTWNLAEDWPR